MSLNTVQLLLEFSVILAYKKNPPAGYPKNSGRVRTCGTFGLGSCSGWLSLGLGVTQVTMQPRRVKPGFGSFIGWFDLRSFSE